MNDSNSAKKIDLKIVDEVIHREAMKGFEPNRTGAVHHSIQHIGQALDVYGLLCDIQHNVVDLLGLSQFSRRSGPHVNDVAHLAKLADDFEADARTAANDEKSLGIHVSFSRFCFCVAENQPHYHGSNDVNCKSRPRMPKPSTAHSFNAIKKIWGQEIKTDFNLIIYLQNASSVGIPFETSILSTAASLSSSKRIIPEDKVNTLAAAHESVSQCLSNEAVRHHNRVGT